MKAFVDCGAFKGTIIRHFVANTCYGAEFGIYAFECNPALSKINYGDNVEVIRKAVWKENGTVKFYMNTRHPTIEGNSVYREKVTGNLDKAHPIVVETIDFSEWLKNKFTTDDFVVVKMNIEGAEYDVLEKLIADGTIALVDELHIQWHVHKIKDMPRSRHDDLVAALAKVEGLKVYPGYGKIRAKK